MPKSFQSLQDFVSHLESKGELIRVTEEVSTELEITEIHRRLIQSNGPAILFENVRQSNGKLSKMPVLINLFGTKERIALGLGIRSSELSKLGETLAFLKHPEAPEKFKDLLQLIPVAKKVLSMRCKAVKTAPCQEKIYTQGEIDLDQLPIQTCWPNEPAPLITWPLVITKGKKEYNVGVYRMQKIGKNKLIMRWLKHRDGAEHYREHKASSPKPLPAAYCYWV